MYENKSYLEDGCSLSPVERGHNEFPSAGQGEPIYEVRSSSKGLTLLSFVVVPIVSFVSVDFAVLLMLFLMALVMILGGKN